MNCVAAPFTVHSGQAVWRRLLERLAGWHEDWRIRLGTEDVQPVNVSATPAISVSNEAAFEAFAVALLSGNTRWDRVERVRGALGEPFANFKPERFARLSEQDIDERILPWFREHKAGAAGLRASLLRLRQTAHLLAGGGQHSSAQHLLVSALASTGGSPEALAMLLGTNKEWKLPGFGVALAAEALRLLGFDLCKPDRHILRAVGSWNFVRFERWEERGPFTPPQARPSELLATMLAVRALAEMNQVAVSYANSVIWTAGAISGARLTNAEFGKLREDL